MESQDKDGLTRRLFLSGSAAAALGAATGALGGGAAASAADYSKIPKLPGELTRAATLYTRAGNPYEMIDVVIQGDRTRLFVPHASKPSRTAWVPVVWFYHSNGSSYSALNTAFNSAAEPTVDFGAISICPNNGGASAWVSPAAIAAQRNAVAYITSLWRPFYNFQRANSGGGALMSWAYSNRIMDRMSGMYMASSVYDVWDAYVRAPEKVGPAYGYDEAVIQATNPANRPQSSWTGTRIRCSYNPADQVVPPAQNALALMNLAGPVATEVSSYIHAGGETTGGHVVPSAVAGDMLLTFKRWAGV
ncbi:hypothetical protein [Microbacterium sp. CFBP9034]|uniref:hypothetical protein n=1 Tax=Microbacterium sp. CFBP9034 TaxID=3096540 RepID=UPI002A6A6BED|nr:hypothetical protein [Microbacterium sp. CFBP9034]MDY0910374.1 hypothetical protein [Microbacterium sp. CFBP9034]